MSHISYRLNPDVVATALEDETVLLNVKTRRYYSLNETGSRVWQRLADGADISDIASSLATDFDVNVDEAHDYVQTHVTDLVSEGLVLEAQSGGWS